MRVKVTDKIDILRKVVIMTLPGGALTFLRGADCSGSPNTSAMLPEELNFCTGTTFSCKTGCGAGTGAVTTGAAAFFTAPGPSS